MFKLLLIILLYPILNAATNYFIIADHQAAWHSFQAIEYCVLAFGIPYFIYLWKPRLKLYQVFQITFVFLVARWILFDISLNLFRSLPFYYVGETAFMDKALGDFQFILKAILLLFAIPLTISLFKNYKRIQL